MLAVAASAAPPSGFLEANIGAPDEPGSVEVDADGVWTVNGAGNDFNNQFEDQLYFVYKSIRGTGSVQARLLEQASPGSQYVGVMVRESIEANAPMASLIMSTSALNWITRPEADAEADRQSDVSEEEYPKFMRVQRVGNAITGFTSADGRLWQQITAPFELPLAETSVMGIAVSSRDPGTLTTALFDNVQVLEGVISVTGAEGAATDTMALLSWQPVATAVGYNVYRGESLDQLKLVNTAGPQTDTFFFEQAAASTSLRNMRYAVGGVFKNADGTNMEGPLILVR
jgi:hypothetical protein